MRRALDQTPRVSRGGAAAVALALGLGLAAPSMGQSVVIPLPGERERVLIGSKREPGTRFKALAAAAAGQDDFDVTHYKIDLDFDDVARRVAGSVTVSATSLVAGLEHVVLDLQGSLVVSSVLRGAVPLAFAQAADLLEITLDRPYAASEPFDLQIVYGGVPLTGGARTFGWNKYLTSGSGEMVWSLSEPHGARGWWPCKDRPDDKALVEEWWTVRSDWVATGNGVLLGVDELPGGKRRFRWRATHPLTTYLVSVAATNYSSFTDSYTPLGGGTMPLEHFVYPEDLADAQVSFATTPQMIEYFATTFGEYPFVEDKYGMSAFPFNGAMEHSTNTSYGYRLIDGTNRYDWVIAHELAHQWWGDSVSPETWRDIWLNEGFASHCEALWAESLGGPASYHAYMNALWRPSFSGPVYDPPSLFSATVYDKGGWVQHMLRGVLGDAAFFQGLRTWHDERRHATGNTAQYQATLEAVHGSPLGWFFQEWVYGTGQPRYEYGWTTADLGGGTLRNWVRIRQVHTDAGPFTMPLRLALVTAAGSEVRTVWNDAADQYFALDTSEPLLDLRFDEDNWVLKVSAVAGPLADADADGVPDGVDNCPSAANAAQGDADSDFAGDVCDADDDGDLLDDGADCAPRDAGQGTPDEVTGFVLVPLRVGPVELRWDAAPRADGYDVVRGDVGGLSAGYGACIATGIAETQFVDDENPPPGQAFAYLVQARDQGCGGAGALGTDSAGAPRPSPCP